jgi:LmbE family N-acetylglucosaminyl deacetylase
MAGLNILGVNAHPHDFTHYAGTLGIHVADGDTVTVVSMTSGATTHNQALDEEMAKPLEERDRQLIDRIVEEYAGQKIEELRTACGVFGITDVRVLPFSDKTFTREKYPDAIDALREIIQDVRPHIMITQNAYLAGRRGHRQGARDDHSETGFASIEARQAAGHPGHDDSRPGHKIAATYFPGVYFGRGEWDFAVDITDFFEKRVEAEATFVTQGHTPEWSRKRMEVELGNAGWFTATGYAEGFVSDKLFLLPKIELPDSMLRQAEESESVRHMRMVGGAKATT